ncbi:MAG TPA: DnaD domain protein [Paenibacillaceae bacterium]
MRVSNVLEFTENHRFVAYRDFALSALDRKVLALLYQPLAGSLAVSFYLLLYHRLGEDEIGYTPPDQQRGLFLGLGLDPGLDGRRRLIEASSRLEAVGLLRVYRRYDPVTEETLYEYELRPPLPPHRFFAHPYLTLLLRDRIGRYAHLELHKALEPDPPADLDRFLSREDVSVPPAEMFRLGKGAGERPEPDAADPFAEAAAAREDGPEVPERIRHADILFRFPRGSANRKWVERLRHMPEAMARINYLAYKYELNAPEICRLLDEDGAFREDGRPDWDLLDRRAREMYRQDRKREKERAIRLARLSAAEKESVEDTAEEPGLPEAAGKAEYGSAAGGAETAAVPEAAEPGLEVPKRFPSAISQQAYNDLLRHQPWTRVLKLFFPGAVPDPFLRIFEKIDAAYRLPEPVINVLIHYVMSMDETQRLSEPFIDAIAANMLAKGIATYEEAVAYVRGQEKLREVLERRTGDGAVRGERAGAEGKRAGGRGRSAGRKPDMPVVEDDGPEREMTPEELANLYELARKFKERTREQG